MSQFGWLVSTYACCRFKGILYIRIYLSILYIYAYYISIYLYNVCNIYTNVIYICVCLLRIACTVPKGNFSNYCKRFSWWSMRHTPLEKKIETFPFFQIELQRKPCLPSATVCLLSSSYASANPHILT